ncbi:flagellar hook capping protein [Lysobacter pythonis]|uniref:Basal-body rod modification protein FlgD n=1 Tax=Solilutibacter pythonis TaxID=2483112 RepID=A0A3M2I3A3_9GAMM|nr:flagellar hook capping FlgD N-terminal domain-containing protein [Lysobacter pythonis]RMH94059.1 flagellar hook capping protein [Lysobacter pythonis]
MEIEGIGNTQNAQASTLANNKAINQEDFIRLFLAQLQFQDPLEPVDNREFLAQLAQFSSLEQFRQTSQNTTDLLSMQAATQAVSLLNKQVEVQGVGAPVNGQVIAVAFTTTGPALSVKSPNGSVLTGIRLSQISIVKP